VKVLVTGSAGHLARAVLPRLCADPRISRVTGVDLHPGEFRHPRFREYRCDIRGPDLAARMADHQAVIHMAFVVMRGDLGRRRRDRALMRDINVAGSRHVFQCAAAAGVERAVHLSSAAAYGAWPDNPPRLEETAVLRPNPGFAYAEDKAEVERWLDAFGDAPRAPALVRLRPHAIVGPHAHPLLRALLRQPFYPRLPDPQPLTQCIWEDDVAEAVLKGLFSPSTGVFNLAAEPAVGFRDLQRHIHRRALPVPFALVRAAVRGLWPLTGAAGEPGWVEGLRHSLALDCSRARRLLGWQPRWSVYDCVQRMTGPGSP